MLQQNKNLIEYVKEFIEIPNIQTFYKLYERLDSAIGSTFQDIHTFLKRKPSEVVRIMLILKQHPCKNFRDGIKSLAEIIIIDIDNPILWILFGLAFIKGGEPRDLSPHVDWNRLIPNIYNKNKNQLVLYCVAKVVSLQPNLAPAWVSLGIWIKQNFNYVIDLPKYLNWDWDRLIANIQNKNYLQIKLSCFTQAIFLDENQSNAWIRLGQAFFEGAQLTDAPKEVRYFLKISGIGNDDIGNLHLALLCLEKAKELELRYMNQEESLLYKYATIQLDAIKRKLQANNTQVLEQAKYPILNIHSHSNFSMTHHAIPPYSCNTPVQSFPVFFHMHTNASSIANNYLNYQHHQLDRTSFFPSSPKELSNQAQRQNKCKTFDELKIVAETSLSGPN